jgi:23S rRNA U2552 (ribose-2'-O)-methylase RlmE/FtsJ
MDQQMTKHMERPIGLPPTYSKTLSQVFIEHDGHLSDKWEHYLAAYEAIFHRFIESQTPVRLLEIGVQNGGSLQIWSKYFPSGSTIVGVDIDPACAGLATDTNVSIRIGDARSKDVLDRLLEETEFDIIIDDGSHRSDDIIAGFDACFGRLSCGGLYIVEDLHCSYWSSHGGGFRMPGSSMEWFKGLTDALNADHFEFDVCARVDSVQLLRLRKLGSQIARITFFDSLVVVEKLASEKQQPYCRAVTGQTAHVEDVVDLMTLSPDTLRTLRLSPSAAAASSPELLDKLASAMGEVGRLRSTLTQAEKRHQEEVDVASARAEKQVAEAVALLAQEGRLRTEAEQRAEQAHRDCVAAEDQLAAYETELSNLRSRAEQVEIERDRLRQECEMIVRSTFWRLTGPARRIVAILPASVRRQARRVARVVYWLSTPHRTGERLAYLRSRKSGGSLAVEGDKHRAASRSARAECR